MVRSSLLEGAERLPPLMETWTGERLPWATTPARRSFSGFAPVDRCPALLAAYAEEAGDRST